MTFYELFNNDNRIDAACFIDGNDDEFVIEFYALPGSIVRAVYNRRSTCTTTSFVDVHTWEYAMLRKWADANDYGAGI